VSGERHLEIVEPLEPEAPPARVPAPMFEEHEVRCVLAVDRAVKHWRYVNSERYVSPFVAPASVRQEQRAA
jgi:hypothetical protein